MTATEDLFTPIHKALRSMIYELGGRLQSVDFSDRTASAAVLADLQHEFGNAVASTCVLCLLHSHASDEERSVFPSMQPIDAGLVRMLIDEHHEIGRKLLGLTKMADDLARVDPPEGRIELGNRINCEANEFFAYYLAHMIKEEVTIVPAMKEHFTDDQMRAMRGAIMGAMPRERLATYLKWMLPSLTLSKLTGMLTGLKRGAPPEFLAFVAGVGAENMEPARWAVVRERVGI